MKNNKKVKTTKCFEKTFGYKLKGTVNAIVERNSLVLVTVCDKYGNTETIDKRWLKGT